MLKCLSQQHFNGRGLTNTSPKKAVLYKTEASGLYS